LDIAVDDAGGVRVVKPLASLRHDPDGFADCGPSVVLQHLSARLSAYVLHDYEMPACPIVEAPVEDLHDVGVDQASRGECLVAEAENMRRVLGEMLRQEFDR